MKLLWPPLLSIMVRELSIMLHNKCTPVNTHNSSKEAESTPTAIELIVQTHHKGKDTPTNQLLPLKLLLQKVNHHKHQQETKFNHEYHCKYNIAF